MRIHFKNVQNANFRQLLCYVINFILIVDWLQFMLSLLFFSPLLFFSFIWNEVFCNGKWALWIFVVFFQSCRYRLELVSTESSINSNATSVFHFSLLSFASQVHWNMRNRNREIRQKRAVLEINLSFRWKTLNPKPTKNVQHPDFAWHYTCIKNG